MLRHKSLVALFVLTTLVLPCMANVKLPAVISSNMVLQQDANAALWGWANPGEKVTFSATWPNAKKISAVTDASGKWKLVTRTPKAGGPYKLTFAGSNTVDVNNVLIGEVWICSGQSNMWWPVWLTTQGKDEIPLADHPDIRLMTVHTALSEKPLDDVNATWVECSPKTVKDFSGVAYYFGLALYKKLNVPIGLIHDSWSGSPAEPWIPRDVLAADPDLAASFEREKKAYADNMKKYQFGVGWHKKDPNKPLPTMPKKLDAYIGGAIYNGMIAPLILYNIRGVIWFQGESNRDQGIHYRKLFSVLINTWRKQWGIGDFPFYFGQIAPWSGMTPDVRESQLVVYRTVPNTGMAVTVDVGEPNNVHFINKGVVGDRLALWALAKTYGFKDIVYSGPLYKSYKVDGDKIRVSFDFAEPGLSVKGDKLDGFTIAGDDQKFVPADASIVGSEVVISSPKVAKPVAARYGWSNNAASSLWNKAGLPASPFRTDDWPTETTGKK